MAEVLERWRGQRVKAALWEMATAPCGTTKTTKQTQNKHKILSGTFYTRHTGIQQLLHRRCTNNIAQSKNYI